MTEIKVAAPSGFDRHGRRLLARSRHESRHCSLSNAFRPRGVNDDFFFGEKLEQTVAFHIDSVSEAVVDCWKHGNDRSALLGEAA